MFAIACYNKRRIIFFIINCPHFLTWQVGQGKCSTVHCKWQFILVGGVMVFDQLIMKQKSLEVMEQCGSSVVG